eukprot:6356115-Amphidinium_carterae.1
MSQMVVHYYTNITPLQPVTDPTVAVADRPCTTNCHESHNKTFVTQCRHVTIARFLTHITSRIFIYASGGASPVPGASSAVTAVTG